MKLVKTTLIILLAFTLVAGFAFAGGQKEKETAGDSAEEEAPKAAMLMSGPINDGGWNQQAYEGLMLLKDELGYEVAYTELVKKAEQKSLFRNYAKKGYDLIFGHGFEFADAVTRSPRNSLR